MLSPSSRTSLLVTQVREVLGSAEEHLHTNVEALKAQLEDLHLELCGIPKDARFYSTLQVCNAGLELPKLEPARIPGKGEEAP
jgi:hypothetical protein